MKRLRVSDNVVELKRFPDGKSFIKHMKDRGLKPRTCHTYYYYLLNLDKFMKDNDVKVLNYNTLENLSREASNENEERRRRMLFFTWNVLKHYYDFKQLDFKPFEVGFNKIIKKTRYPKHEPVRFWMDEDELESMIEDGVKYNYAMDGEENIFTSVRTDMDSADRRKWELFIKLTYYTGLRVSEMLLIQKRDLSFGTPPTIKIEQEISKSDKSDTVRIPIKIAEKLKAYVEGKEKDNYIFRFMDERGTKTLDIITKETSFIDYRLRKFLDEAGLNDVKERLESQSLFMSAHKLRHAYAHWLENLGFKLSEIQLLMRHSSIDTTSKYLGIDERTLDKRFIDLVEKRNNT